ncbi:MAG: heme NO-binding protein [Bacteroidetes bacterium B1(2017)]|nr:MAG: heme NO-binding protein [Bacteroidetes bacterium B1(2017)]
MYGLVNQGIQGLIIDNYGADIWEKIKEKAGFSNVTFLASQLYDDSVTFTLASTASEILGVSLENVLKDFGKYWVLNIGKEKYGTLMKSGGDSIIQFLKNLPNFHSRVMLIYPKAETPEFKVDIISENKIHLHYYSSRIGLTDFMFGLIDGLSIFFDAPCSVNHLKHTETDTTYDLFEITVQ